MTTATLKYSRWTHDANTLSPAALHYLLQNGFTQSMTDAAAMTKKERAKILSDAGHDHDAKIALGDASGDISPEGVAAIAKQVDLWRDERYEDIINGRVGTRAGGSGVGRTADPLARETNRLAQEFVYNRAKAKYLARPTGEVLKRAVEIVMAKHADAFRAEAKANLERQAKLVAAAGDDEDDDMFAPIAGDDTNTEEANAA